jgi:hypothetical protein
VVITPKGAESNIKQNANENDNDISECPRMLQETSR